MIEVLNFTTIMEEHEARNKIKGVPNVPEELVFDNKDDAKDWVKSLGMMLDNF